MQVIVVALLGAVCWGLAPIFGKMGLRNIQPLDGLVARTVITALFLMLWVLGSGGFRRIASLPAQDWFFLSVEAFFATLAGDLAYFAALKWGSAGVVAVILAAAPIITVWAAGVFLQEAFSPLKLLGALLVVIGVILVGSGGGAA